MTIWQVSTEWYREKLFTYLLRTGAGLQISRPPKIRKQFFSSFFFFLFFHIVWYIKRLLFFFGEKKRWRTKKLVTIMIENKRNISESVLGGNVYYNVGPSAEAFNLSVRTSQGMTTIFGTPEMTPGRITDIYCFFSLDSAESRAGWRENTE